MCLTLVIRWEHFAKSWENSPIQVHTQKSPRSPMSSRNSGCLNAQEPLGCSTNSHRCPRMRWTTFMQPTLASVNLFIFNPFSSMFIHFLGRNVFAFHHPYIHHHTWSRLCTLIHIQYYSIIFIYIYIIFMFDHFLERNVVTCCNEIHWNSLKFYANPCNQATKLHHITRANLTLKFPRSPRTLANDRLWTAAHAGPYKLQGGADRAIPSGNNLSTTSLYSIP